MLSTEQNRFYLPNESRAAIKKNRKYNWQLPEEFVMFTFRCSTLIIMCASGKLITGAKILCPPSSEAFHLADDELIPTAVEEESEEEDEEEPDVTEMEESGAELDDDTQPLKASS